MAAHRDDKLALLAASPDAKIAPGSFGATWALDIVQIDHTPADVVVQRFTRRAIGRPWLTLAIDLARRRSSSGSSARARRRWRMLVSRIAQPKQAWLEHLGPWGFRSHHEKRT